MKTVCIENSTASGSLAFADGNQIIDVFEFSRSGALAVSLQNMLKRQGSPDQIVVGIGPGSYSGLRVAAATALGLSAALNLKVHGCPSVLGYEAPEYSVVGDARRGTVFVATVRNYKLVSMPILIPYDEFQQQLSNFELIYAIGTIPGLDGFPISVPKAQNLVFRTESFTDSYEPLYLKEAHVTGAKIP
ncbi:MAG: tRNA (adenosine(37)-N6)-threonylcarbamoyltransferase complex dimerization subunit type 1 TsaB [Verrucomicrobia bacterium]|nr:tRNA (adenosine(37)-N6)-threonylcarbamoyltransferase complex dimerization subunit type 1 TsaB [Verrucomicrobiota bacterium]MBV9673283.1 tRNA (adenosine(37)-N6)-threonylcarbamoyltransferase complex dimerization subunit type 1 TsaB [Verrucomicrobiota bacterium]